VLGGVRVWLVAAITSTAWAYAWGWARSSCAYNVCLPMPMPMPMPMPLLWVLSERHPRNSAATAPSSPSAGTTRLTRPHSAPLASGPYVDDVDGQAFSSTAAVGPRAGNRRPRRQNQPPLRLGRGKAGRVGGNGEVCRHHGLGML
jgi:hypothetical protein